MAVIWHSVFVVMMRYVMDSYMYICYMHVLIYIELFIYSDQNNLDIYPVMLS